VEEESAKNSGEMR